MSRILENELYGLHQMPKGYDYNACHKCKCQVFDEEINPESEPLDPWTIRTCENCGSRWEISLIHQSIYFYGTDEQEAMKITPSV
ncbi:TPA: hypothetical protein RQJ58_002171 [Vibrio vulnificus]|nr:hypothetical protein [Vibrio vulnificus]